MSDAEGGPVTPDAATTVLIVDDHPVVRSGLRALLENAPGIEVVGEAANGVEALKQAARLHPHVVLSDLRLGDGMDGVGVARALRDVPDVAVLILTTYDHDTDIMRAVEAGAVGYLLKDADPGEIVRAVTAAAAGEMVISPDQKERVVQSMRAATRTLSDREREVLALAAQGLSNTAIAASLFVSEATVKTHLGHVYDKLGAPNRTAAVATARERGIL